MKTRQRPAGHFHRQLLLAYEVACTGGDVVVVGTAIASKDPITDFKRHRRDSKHCATVDIQIISWQAHAPTGLNGWARFQNDAIRERPCVSNHFGFPSMQAASVGVPKSSAASEA